MKLPICRLGLGPTSVISPWAKAQSLCMTFFLSFLLLNLIGCSPVKTIVTSHYQLSAFGTKQCSVKRTNLTLHVSPPEASAGYQTDQMLYMKTPYQLDVFAKNSWVSPPGEMLYPLLIQSLQKAEFFHAVTSGSYTETPDYRLDTLLISLHQNFLKKPSRIEFSAKVVLTNVKENRVVASRIINLCLPCPMDTPVGGVIAANKATQLFTAEVTQFVLSMISTGHKHPYR